MAVGDAVVDVASIAGAADLDYQPAAGVEACITSVVVGTGNSLYAKLYNGTDEGIITGRAAAVSDVRPNVKLFINNTDYLRIGNDSGGALVGGYSGVQTK